MPYLPLIFLFFAFFHLDAFALPNAQNCLEEVEQSLNSSEITRAYKHIHGSNHQEFAQYLESVNKLQEAAWEYKAGGNFESAQELMQYIKTTALCSKPIEIKDFRMGISSTYKVLYANGLSFLFKVDGTGLGSSKHEELVYQIDQILELNLVPFTTQTGIDINQDGEINLNGEFGSLMIFLEDSNQGDFYLGSSQMDAAFHQRVASSKYEESFREILLLDYLIANMDRSNRNWLIDSRDQPIAIDHNRVFDSINSSKYSIENYRPIINDPVVYERLKTELTPARIRDISQGILSEKQIDEFISRRNRALEYNNLLKNRLGRFFENLFAN